MDIISFIDRGGILVYILIGMNIIGFAIMILKFFSLLQFKKNIKQIAMELNKNIINKDQLHIESQVEEQVKKLESGLGTIKIIASTAPLLGLLGTVFGILLTFDTISKIGMNDPLSFSGGISIALITTVVGLVVAIPHHIYYNYYIGALDSLEIKLKNEILHTK
jgi:biopolymer transport protein ExbB